MQTGQGLQVRVRHAAIGESSGLVSGKPEAMGHPKPSVQMNETQRPRVSPVDDGRFTSAQTPQTLPIQISIRVNVVS